MQSSFRLIFRRCRPTPTIKKPEANSNNLNGSGVASLYTTSAKVPLDLACKSVEIEILVQSLPRCLLK